MIKLIMALISSLLFSFEAEFYAHKHAIKPFDKDLIPVYIMNYDMESYFTIGLDGFKQSKWGSAMVFRESRGLPYVINRNYNGTFDFGKYQINSCWWQKWGINPWKWYKNGKWLMSEKLQDHYLHKLLSCHAQILSDYGIKPTPYHLNKAHYGVYGYLRSLGINV